MVVWWLAFFSDPYSSTSMPGALSWTLKSYHISTLPDIVHALENCWWMDHVHPARGWKNVTESGKPHNHSSLLEVAPYYLLPKTIFQGPTLPLSSAWLRALPQWRGWKSKVWQISEGHEAAADNSVPTGATPTATVEPIVSGESKSARSPPTLWSVRTWGPAACAWTNENVTRQCVCCSSEVRELIKQRQKLPVAGC